MHNAKLTVLGKLSHMCNFISISDYSKHKSYYQGRRSRGFQGGMCTLAFLPSPGIYSIKCA